MRPKGSAAELERRRRRAVQLVESGESPAVVARVLGVTTSSLHRWRRLARQPEGLVARPVSGAKRRLSDEQLCKLERLLRQGATAHGYPNEPWTAARVAQLIQRHFGVDYHPDYVRQLLRRRLNWTSHKPQQRASQHNDKEIERWKADEFPRILREAWLRQAHVAFLDESGFLLSPLVRRTLAPRGERVVLRYASKHKRISTIGCVTLSPQAMRVGLYFEMWLDQSVHGEEVVDFLKCLTGQVPGAWTIVWDRGRIHSRSAVVKGDYVLAVKDNQPHLLEDIQNCFTRALDTNFEGLDYSVHESSSNGHGRVETRKVYTILNPDGIRDLALWKDLKAITLVYSQRQVVGQEGTEELRYYIGSKAAQASAYAEYIRGHWGIENGQHWVLDVCFDEDRSRMRTDHSAENMALLRRLALSLLKQHGGKGSVRGKRKKSGWNDQILVEVLSGK